MGALNFWIFGATKVPYRPTAPQRKKRGKKNSAHTSDAPATPKSEDGVRKAEEAILRGCPTRNRFPKATLQRMRPESEELGRPFWEDVPHKITIQRHSSKNEARSRRAEEAFFEGCLTQFRFPGAQQQRAQIEPPSFCRGKTLTFDKSCNFTSMKRQGHGRGGPTIIIIKK